MVKEIKVTLPLYKIACAVSFVIILCLIRGVTVSYEIGIVLEPFMAILAVVFCADTYVKEIVSKRSEIWKLYPMRRQMISVGRRMVIQEMFLLLLAVMGYGLFFIFQKPLLFSTVYLNTKNEMRQFVIYLAVMAVTLIFWGMLSNTISCIFRNSWFGIGGALMIWILMASRLGERYFGSWNLFSYMFRDIENDSDLSWMAGKGISIVFSIAMFVMLPQILKKRG